MTSVFKLIWRKRFWIWLGLGCLSALSLLPLPIRAEEPLLLTVQLRYSDGTAVAGEPIILERLPDAEPIKPPCLTDQSGRCTWPVRRGLYQVLFERPLDEISALALAEGGLRGFGLTVGDDAIFYHFTFHSDGGVYFDAAPEAAVPSPIIPAGALLHGGVAPTPTAQPLDPKQEPITPEPTSLPETAVAAQSENSWHFLLFIAGGLLLGGSAYWLTQHRRQQSQAKAEESND